MPDTYFEAEADAWATANLSAAIEAIGGDTVVRAKINALATKLPPIPTSPPTILGDVEVGRTLTGIHGTYLINPISYTYRWSIDGVIVPNATGLTYTPQIGDLGKSVAFEETPTNSIGAGSPASSGGAVVGAGIGTPPGHRFLQLRDADGNYRTVQLRDPSGIYRNIALGV